MKVVTTLYSDSPSVLALEALLPGGLETLPSEVARALGQDQESEALSLANAMYARTQGKSLLDVIIYGVLLTYRELGDEALGVVRRGLEHHADAISLQLLQIDALTAAGRDEAALSLMEALLDVPMQEARHWAFLGDLFWDAAMSDQAAVAYENAVQRGTQSPETVLRLADIYVDAERHYEAAELFETAGRLAPDEVSLWLGACEAWILLEEWDRAVHAAKRCTTLDPDDSDCWSLLGIAHRERGDVEEAIDAFRRAQTLSPDEPVVWLNLGGVQLSAGLPEDARASYAVAARLDPEDVEAINGMVAAAYDLGDMELAQRLAREALELAPDHADSWYNLGAIALSLRQGAEAREALEEARSREPGNPRLVATLATAMLLEDEIDEALNLLGEALGDVDDDAELLLDFAQIMFRHGGPARVLELLERVTCTDPIWSVMVPIYEFLARGLRGDTDFAAALVTEFVKRVEASPDTIPVFWDFDELERLGFSLPDDLRKTFLDMHAVLEGRRDPDSLNQGEPNLRETTP